MEQVICGKGLHLHRVIGGRLAELMITVIKIKM